MTKIPNPKYCFGIIPIRNNQTSIQVLLVQHMNGGHWSFPKGHQEIGETGRQTAERELYEETGLKVSKYMNFQPFQNYYHVVVDNQNVNKTVELYVATVKGVCSLQEGEIASSQWVGLQDLSGYADFPEQKIFYQMLSTQLLKTI